MSAIRNQLVAVMRATLADEAARGDWTYHEVRPMPVPTSWQPGQQVQGDCSKGCQYLCAWAKSPFDPMTAANGGAKWGPWGNSQTIWLACQHLDQPSQLQAGDFVTFGVDGDQHATMVLEPGPDPLLWSFGHQGAPDTYRLSQDGRPYQLCRNPVPRYVPTRADRLRARTGWFAWMAWALGEGDWKAYGKANRTVRPNVPKLIPLAWWRRRARFLLRRKNGNRATR